MSEQHSMQTPCNSPTNVLACGTGTTIVLNNEGEVWCTGLNYNLQLGFNNVFRHTDKCHCWTCVKALSREYFHLLQNTTTQHIPRFRSIYTCGSTTFAMTKEKRLFSWGNNEKGQLAQGDADTTSLPGAVLFLCDPITHELSNMPPIWQVACGISHTLALTYEWGVLVCGDNSRGQLGRCDIPLTASCTRFIVLYPPHNKLGSIQTAQKIRTIASGAYTCAMIQEDSHLYMWGCNINSQVPGADPSEMLPQTTPVCIQKDRDNYHGSAFLVESISIGYEHCACITTDNKVWTWGMNTYGKLGNHTKNGSSPNPFCVTNPSQLLDMPTETCCGGHHTLILTATGSLWAAGSFKLGLGIDGGHDSYTCCFKKVKLPPVPRKYGGGQPMVLAFSTGKTHTAIITTGNIVMTCGKMKCGMPVSNRLTNTDTTLLTSPYHGFGGLGYFQGLAQQGHVSTFKQVHQLINVMGFRQSLSINTLAKVQAFLIGVHLRNQPSANHSLDRIYMNLLPIEVLDLMILELFI